MKFLPVGILGGCLTLLTACTNDAPQLNADSTNPSKLNVATAPATAPVTQPITIDRSDPRGEDYHEAFSHFDPNLVLHDFCDRFTPEELVSIGLQEDESSETERSPDGFLSSCDYKPYPQDPNVLYAVATNFTQHNLYHQLNRLLLFEFEGQDPRIYFQSPQKNGESSELFNCTAATSTSGGTVNLTTKVSKNATNPHAYFNDSATTCKHSHDKLIELINLSGIRWPQPVMQPVNIDPNDPASEGYQEAYDYSDPNLVPYDFCDRFTPEEFASIGLQKDETFETSKSPKTKLTVCQFKPFPENPDIVHLIATDGVPYKKNRSAGLILDFEFEGRHPRIYFFAYLPNGETDENFDCSAATSTTSGTLFFSTLVYKDLLDPSTPLRDLASTCKYSHDKLIELINLSGIQWP
ncbi:hypothetical protein N7326_04160 [Corynebacterium sp. ES2794-CONJ1]|uniref:hypothetical protein n=1 Tax=Corynebacterium sp. ES2794-CONJ1 TaxID=2980553 RepID=UPI0021DA1B3F|nr:hypothetical protein [Corynebacterium sp. ES2794-CONJ1]MCU9519068.1 hypothetical protein [Corynebacterium sp. ES2794-CONJ1]